MNTTDNVCLSDSDLLRLWNEDAGEGDLALLRRHLSSCPSCTQRWDEFSRDARLVAQTLQEARSRPSSPAEPCPSEEELAEYASDVLAPQEAQAVERHLEACRSCAARVRSARFFAWEAEQEPSSQTAAPWRAEMLGLLSRVPEAANLARSLRRGPPARPLVFDQPVRLACLMPRAQAALRLAAAAGEGLSEQVFRQDDPPFEIRLTQFGQELRINVSAPGSSIYANCLAELRLLEGTQCRLSRILLIQEGQGRCVVEPGAIESSRPDQEPVKPTIEPLLTADRLAAAGHAAFEPILEQLLDHADVEVRLSVVRMLGQVATPRASILLERACQDGDGQVRALAQEALKTAGNGG